MKTFAEGRTRAPSRIQATPVPQALAHQAQLRSALLRAGVQPCPEIGAVNDPSEREHTTPAPEADAAAPSIAADRGMFDAGIKLIEEWCNDKARQDRGTTRDGNKEKEIVKLLKKLNKDGHIKYEEMEARGDWDGTDIRVNANYRSKFYVTACVLVHEGSHAVWSKNNPTPKGPPKSICFENGAQTECGEENGAQNETSEEEDAQFEVIIGKEEVIIGKEEVAQSEIDSNEKEAQFLQAKFYIWLRTKKNALVDIELESRLSRLGVAYPPSFNRNEE